MSTRGAGAADAQTPMTKRMLKTADPTIVPKPRSDRLKVATKEVNSSGAEPPAAIRVAPAMSRDMCMSSAISSRAGTKYSSQTIASARNMYVIPPM